MSDAFSTDDANASELTDADKLPAEYPPEEPLGVEDYGVTAAEEAIDEPLEERVRREEPDAGRPGASDTEPDRVGPLVEPEAGGLPDVTAESVAGEAGGVGEDLDQLDPGDVATGDDTTRDAATERAPGPPAEEAAMHVTDPPPMGDGDGYVEG